MYGETLDFQCHTSNSNLEYPIGKSIFAVNFPLKLFRITVANVYTKCLKLGLKSLRTLFDAYLDYMLAKFEPNRMVRNVQKLYF